MPRTTSAPSPELRASLFRLFVPDTSTFEPGDWLSLADGRWCRVHQVRRHKLVVRPTGPPPGYPWRRSPIAEALADLENAALFAN